MIIKKLILAVMIVNALFIVSQTVLANEKQPVGKLMFAIGKVIVVSKNGKEKRVRRGAKIFEGDLIKTNKKGQAQIKFKDGARISVRANSEFKIEVYVYKKNADVNTFKSELSLLKGGIRSITGAIGKSNKKSYRMKTVIATIGIRGTDYSLMLCDQNCNSQGGGSVNSGLYVGVVNGGVTLQNDAGSMDVSPNQYAMVGSSSTMPKMLPKAPSFLMFDKVKVSKSERAKIAKSFAKRKDSSRKNGSAAKDSSKKQASSSRPQQQRQSRQTQSRTSSGQTSSKQTSASQSREVSPSTATNSTSTPSEIETVSTSESSASTAESMIESRYSESNEVSAPSVEIVETIPTAEINNTSFTTASVASTLVENITPTEEVLVAEELAAVAVAADTSTNPAVVGDTVDPLDSVPVNDEILPVNDEILPVTESNHIPSDVVNTGNTSLSVNPLTRFFNFVFGFSGPQNENEITLLDTKKVKDIYQVDSTDLNRTSYVKYSLDTAKQVDFGFDPDTGLSWGRWSSGNINQTIGTADGETTTSVDLTNQSLHWIMGAEGSAAIQLPITGVRNFVLMGNTNPTDNFGNVGILGSASLTADFDAQTVEAGVNLSVNQQVWEGTQQNIPLDMNNGQFGSDQLSVQVSGGSDMGGSLTGGLTDGATNGGGFTYRMDAVINGQSNQVTGAAAFREVP